MSTTEVTKTTPELQWDAFDKLITERNCKVKILAKALGIKSAELRDAIVSHYGDRVEFKRGRCGGVYWKK